MTSTILDRIEAHAGLCMAALVHRRGVAITPSNEELAEQAITIATDLVGIIEAQRKRGRAKEIELARTVVE